MLNNCLSNAYFTNFTYLIYCNFIMKVFIYTLLALAIGLIIFNITQLDFQHLTEGNSMVALIGIIASLCAVCILIIFKMARNIEEKTRS